MKHCLKELSESELAFFTDSEHSSPNRKKIYKEKCTTNRATTKRKENPFFKFLREYRQKVTGKKATEVAKDCGAAWRKMTESQKKKYR